MNNNTGFAAGYCSENGGRIVRTCDGGKNWEALETPVAAPITGIHFVDEKKGFLVTLDGLIMSTMDCGKNWTQISL